jgi:hypothetical protein
MIWFKRVGGIDSEIMRQAAKNVGVSWDYQPIEYRSGGIAFSNGDSKDAKLIKDQIKRLIGQRPVEIDEPTIDQSDQINNT